MKKHFEIINLGTARILTTLASFVATTGIARGLSAEDLGVFSILVNIYSYSVLLSEFGMRSLAMGIATRESSGYVAKKYVVIRSGFAVLFFILSIIFGSIYYPQWMTYLLVLQLSIFSASFLFDWLLIARGAVAAAGIVLLLRSIFYCAIVFFLLFVSIFSLSSLCWTFTISWWFAALVSIALCKKYDFFYGDDGGIPKTLDLLKRGLPILWSTVLVQLLMSVDLLWVGGYLGASTAGYYYLASTVITAGLVFANAMSQIALSRYADKFDGEGSRRRLLQTDSLYMSLIGLAGVIALALFGESFFVFVFGQEYRSSVEIMIGLGPYLFLYHLFALFYSVAISSGEEKKVSFAITLSAFLIVPVYLASGYIGSVYAFVVGKTFLLFISVTSMLFLLSRELRAELCYCIRVPAVLFFSILVLTLCILI